jgi:hypothetical protein
VDIRYLDHQLGGGNIYSMTILENYSRAVLAGAISRTQDHGVFNGLVHGDSDAWFPWAHRTRHDGRATAEVLPWMCGHVWEEALHYAFYATRFGRQLDKAGYIRFRHDRLYAEPGLERGRVAMWLYKEHLRISESNNAYSANTTTKFLLCSFLLVC